jgi:hypothetical protein
MSQQTQDPPEQPPEADPNDPNNITIDLPGATPPPPAPPAPPTRTQRSGGDVQAFTAEEVERIRNEERDRYAAQLKRADELADELAGFRKAEEERQKADEKTRRDAERAVKKKEEEEMELRDLIAKKDLEWEQRLVEERAEREKAFALLEQERRHAQLQTYMSQRMAAEAEQIDPELRDLVSGNSETEIDASIELLKSKSQRISGNYQQVIQRGNAQRPTVGVTAPPVGPMETSQTSQVLTPDDIRAMNPEEYATHRDALLKAASQSRRQ